VGRLVVECFHSCMVMNMLLQVTTHSHLLIRKDEMQLAKLIGLKRDAVVRHSLQAFDTEQQFCKMLKYVTFIVLYISSFCSLQLIME